MSLTISATSLGMFAANRFCERCAWTRLHVKPLPFQAFPGIFSSIDRYNKLVIRKYFERAKSLPSWLEALGEVDVYIEPPHYTRFSILDRDTGATLRGEADGIFRLVEGSHAIVDYKTSRYTRAQGGMIRQYEAQLNAYAYIAERLDLAPVTRLALVYMEPVTDEQVAGEPSVVDDSGFSMGFRGTVVPVQVRPDEQIPPLLREACRISEMGAPPPPSEWCNDCKAVEALIEAMV